MGVEGHAEGGEGEGGGGGGFVFTGRLVILVENDSHDQ